jgi:hypothetical protein
MPHLRQLSIEKDITIDLLERIDRYRFEQIHKLEIGVSGQQTEYIIEKLSRHFPYVQYLIYKSPIQSKDTIIRVIDRFEYLTHVSFLANFCENPISIAQYSQRLIRDKFTCRVDRPSTSDVVNNHLGIHFWIGDEVSHCYEIILLHNFHYSAFNTFTIDVSTAQSRISLVSIQIHFI